MILDKFSKGTDDGHTRPNKNMLKKMQTFGTIGTPGQENPTESAA